MLLRNPNFGQSIETTNKDEALPEIALSLDGLNLSKEETYDLFHSVYSQDGEYSSEVVSEYPALIGEWVLLRNNRDSADDTDYHMVLRATEEFTRAKANRSHVSGGLLFNSEPVRNNHYSPDGLMMALTDGKSVYQPEISYLIGKSSQYPGSTAFPKNSGIEDERMVAAFQIDDNPYLKMILDKGRDTGVVTLPNGETGWVIDRQRSKLEASHARTSASEGDRFDTLFTQRGLGSEAIRRVVRFAYNTA